MFTPKKIDGAFNKLFCMYDMKEFFEACDEYEEEMEYIDPDILSVKYQKEAKQVFEYLVSSGPEDEGTYHGGDLFERMAVCVARADSKPFETKRIRIVTGLELWLLEDMTFAQVDCVRVLTLKNKNVTSVTEHRRLINTIEREEDIMIDLGYLICSLDDACLFTRLDLDQKKEDQKS